MGEEQSREHVPLDPLAKAVGLHTASGWSPSSPQLRLKFSSVPSLVVLAVGLVVLVLEADQITEVKPS